MSAAAQSFLVLYVGIGTSLATFDRMARSSSQRLTVWSAFAAALQFVAYLALWPLYLYFEIQRPPP